MAIVYSAEHRVFKLDTASTSYLLQVGPENYLLHLYYGAKVSDADLGSLSYTVYHSSHYPRVRMETPPEPFFSKGVHRMEYSCNG